MAVKNISKRKFTKQSLEQMLQKVNDNKNVVNETELKNVVSFIKSDPFESNLKISSQKYNEEASGPDYLKLKKDITITHVKKDGTQESSSGRINTNYTKLIFSNSDTTQSAGFIYCNYDSACNNEYPSTKTIDEDKNYSINTRPNYDGVIVKLDADCLFKKDEKKYDGETVTAINTHSAWNHNACFASHTVSAGQMIIARDTSGSTEKTADDSANIIEMSSYNPRLVFVNKNNSTLAYTPQYQAAGLIYSDYNKSTNDICHGSLTLTGWESLYNGKKPTNYQRTYMFKTGALSASSAINSNFSASTISAGNITGGIITAGTITATTITATGAASAQNLTATNLTATNLSATNINNRDSNFNFQKIENNCCYGWLIGEFDLNKQWALESYVLDYALSNQYYGYTYNWIFGKLHLNLRMNSAEVSKNNIINECSFVNINTSYSPRKFGDSSNSEENIQVCLYMNESSFKVKAYIRYSTERGFPGWNRLKFKL